MEDTMEETEMIGEMETGEDAIGTTIEVMVEEETEMTIEVVEETETMAEAATEIMAEAMAGEEINCKLLGIFKYKKHLSIKNINHEKINRNRPAGDNRNDFAACNSTNQR